ncbi:MAG: type I toxin-antitoxin system SymE family toxin [Tannerellaceae bacterium]|nr:type I toxin-antitoxin system SymE family toxin [Tannerellaceae bacterium]
MPNNFKETINVKVTPHETSNPGFKSRFLTLCCKDGKRDENNELYFTPTVTLAGQWFYDAGFQSGQRIELVIGNRQIVIRVDREPGDRREPSKRDLTVEVKRLRKQLEKMSGQSSDVVRGDKVIGSRSRGKGLFAE